MEVANERIKAEAKAIPKEIGEAIKEMIATPEQEPVKEVHKESVPQQIYIGPNLLGLPTYTVVESAEIPHIQGFIKDCPEIEKLFVPVEKMAETESRIKQKGTLEHRYFSKVAEFKAGKEAK